jgi:hypothetical protein
VGPVFFPLDKAWGLDASVYSPELKRDLVWLSGWLPYAQAEAVLARNGKRTISDSSLWRTVERQGHRLTAAIEATEPVAATRPEDDQPWNWGKMLSMDGGLVNIRQEGWKELKVGLIGNVVSDDPPDSSVIPDMHTVPLAYTAVLGDAKPSRLCWCVPPKHKAFSTQHHRVFPRMGRPGFGAWPTATSLKAPKSSIGITLDSI